MGKLKREGGISIRAKDPNWRWHSGGAKKDGQDCGRLGLGWRAPALRIDSFTVIISVGGIVQGSPLNLWPSLRRGLQPDLRAH